MVAAVGRELLVEQNDLVIAGLRTATLSWSGGSINITSGEDDGYRLLLEASGEEQIDLSIEGIMKNHTFLSLALGTGNRMLDDITITWPKMVDASAAGATLTGDFRLSSFEQGAPYNDAITFTGTLESSGAWVFTPEA